MRKRRQREDGLPASVTVEAAYVVPIVMMVVFGLIALTFRLYNRIKLIADVDRCAGFILAGKLDADEAREEAQRRLKGYFAAEPEDIEVSVTEDTVTISAGVRSTMNTNGLTLLPADIFGHITYSTKVRDHDRCLTMRRYRAGEDAMKLAKRVMDGSGTDR